MYGQLIVVGGGGFAREIIWLARACGREVVGVLDDAPDTHGSRLSEVPVLGPVAAWRQWPEARFVVAVGAPRTRARIVAAMETLGQPTFDVLVHPSVQRSRFVEYGAGTVVCANTVITTQVTLGRHVVVNGMVTVGHDAVIEDFVTVAPHAGISGNVHLGAGVEIGTGACLRQGLVVGAGAVVGMGAVLVKDVAPGAVVVGNPAQPIKTLPAWPDTSGAEAGAGVGTLAC